MAEDRDILRHAYGGRRVSRQRRVIAETTQDLGRAFTIDELSRAVRDQYDEVGVATVYRAVAALEESGWLARVGEREGSTLFARCVEEEHHHHLVCTRCGGVSQVACPLRPRAIARAADGGFEITHHEITLYGLCADCRASGWLGGEA